MTALLPLATFVPILDGDPVAARIYNGHYSSEKSRARRLANGTLQFGGPSERLILSTPCRRALFGWRRQQFRADDQRGVECFIFSNLGAALRSSALIREADRIADERWPGERHFTFVNALATCAHRSPDRKPGACSRSDQQGGGSQDRRGSPVTAVAAPLLQARPAVAASGDSVPRGHCRCPECMAVFVRRQPAQLFCSPEHEIRGTTAPPFAAVC